MLHRSTDPVKNGKTKSHMLNEQFSTLAMDNHSNICYIADPVTYELLYINRKGRELAGIGNERKGLKCYQVLQGLDAPCDFCTNHLLQPGKEYCWEFYNSKFKKFFNLRDTLININGRLVRLEWAVDITAYREETKELSDRLFLEETLLHCIQTLSGEQDVQTALNTLLAMVGGYYGANRAYIFEFNMAARTTDNTYEWCREGVSSEKDKLQEIPLSAIHGWIERFKQSGTFFITSLQGDLDPDSEDYKILEPQGIESLMAAPLMEKGEIIGFLGVDDPSVNILDNRLLCSVSLMIQEDLEKRRMLAELERMSYVDPLTGLANRNKYIARLRELERTPPACLGVIYFDINGLKAANDNYGHAFGDHLISRASEMLTKFFHNDVYRTGGDEFVVLCPDQDQDLFESMLSEFRSLAAADKDLHLSIGGNWRKGELDIREQTLLADELMYIDKQTYYKTLLNSTAKVRIGEAQILLDDIAAGMFVVYLQPQVDLRTEKIVGAEALIRRKNPEGGLVSPARFIPTYEKEGIIRHLDFFVLETVCAALRRWKAEGHVVPISVNLSRVTLLEHNIANQLAGVCARHGIDPQLICIEVTESISRMDTPALEKLISRIREKGFSISLDDFGAQYSNLAILTAINFNEIKFDRSLINGLGDNQKNNIIMEHVIGMCHDFDDTHSLAEGIETVQQKRILTEYKCKYGQGYLFYRPMDMETFWTWYQCQREAAVPVT